MNKLIKKIKETMDLLIDIIILLWNAAYGYFIAAIILNLLIGLIMPFQVMVWKKVIDNLAEIVIAGSDINNNIFISLLFYFCLQLLKQIIQNINQYVLTIYSELIDRSITEKMLKKVSSFELYRFDDSQFYNKIEMANKETAAREIGVLQTLLSVVQNIVSFIGMIVILLNFSKVLSLIIIFVPFPAFFLNYNILNKLFSIFEKRSEDRRYINTLKNILINYNCIKEIKVCNCNLYIIMKICKVMSRNIDEDKHIRKKLTTQRTLGSMVEEILTFILKVYIIVIAIYQKLTIGTITMYISSLDNVKEICKEILSSITSTYEDCLYIKNYFEIMQEDTVDEKDKICIDGKIDLIEFRNVSFRYPGELHNTLNNINVKIKKNTTYALIGLNGSGKTTFLKLLLKLYKPTAGEIYLNGVNLDDYNQADLFSNIGVVFQDFIRYPFDVKTNIAVGNGGNEIDINYIKKISNMLGLEKDIKELKNEYDTQLKKEWTEGTELSGGQWQKIAIARGLIKKNYSMLILDEPTAALDSLSEYNIFQKFKSIKRGKITIFVTHRMCNVPLADEIIVLKNGSILEQGTHSDLMDIKGEYYALYNNQLNMYRRERE